MLWRTREDPDVEQDEKDSDTKMNDEILDRLDDVERTLDKVMDSLKKVLEVADNLKKQNEELIKKEKDYEGKIAGLESQLNIQTKFMQDLVLQLVNKPVQPPTVEIIPEKKGSVAEYIARKNGSGSHKPRLP